MTFSIVKLILYPEFKTIFKIIILKEIHFSGALTMVTILGNLLSAIAIVLSYAINLYMYVIIARAILSWVNPDPYNPIVRFLHNATEPLMYRIREKIPSEFGGIDISPIIIIFILIFLDNFVVASLSSISRNLIYGF